MCSFPSGYKRVLSGAGIDMAINYSIPASEGTHYIGVALRAGFDVEPFDEAYDDYRQFSGLDRFGDVHLETCI